MIRDKNNIDDKSFSNMLKRALIEAYEKEFEELPSCEELDALYKPSPEYNKKFEKMISEYFKE